MPFRASEAFEVSGVRLPRAGDGTQPHEAYAIQPHAGDGESRLRELRRAGRIASALNTRPRIESRIHLSWWKVRRVEGQSLAVGPADFCHLADTYQRLLGQRQPMMTIRPSSDTDNASTPPEAAANTEEHKKRIPLIWIPGTIGVGLLIAAIYLGGRIVKAHTQEPEAIHVATPVTMPVKSSAAPTVPQPAPPAPTRSLPPTPGTCRRPPPPRGRFPSR